MQIKTGLISVTNGNSLVTGNGSVDWSQVTVSCVIVILGQVYDIVAVDAGAKTLNISPEYAGTTAADIAYVIVRDFTINYGFPLMNPGDLEGAALFSRAIAKIDQLLLAGAGTQTSTASLVSSTAHGFIVGNALRVDGSGNWALANSASAGNSVVVGVVTEVVDANTFRMRTEGYVSGIVGLTLTAGKLYYLRNTPVSGGGGNVNLVDDSSGAFTYVGNIKVPVIVATSATAGYLLSLANATSGIFGLSANGLVPGPASLTGSFLRDDGTWQSAVISNASVKSEHLYDGGTINWTAFAAGAANYSILKHIVDLNTRVTNLTAATSGGNYVRNAYIVASNGAGSFNYTVPAGISVVTIALAGVSRLDTGAGSGDLAKPPLSTVQGYKGSPLLTTCGQEGFCKLLVQVQAGDLINIELAPFSNTTFAGDIASVRLNGSLLVKIVPVAYPVVSSSNMGQIYEYIQSVQIQSNVAITASYVKQANTHSLYPSIFPYPANATPLSVGSFADRLVAADIPAATHTPTSSYRFIVTRPAACVLEAGFGISMSPAM